MVVIKAGDAHQLGQIDGVLELARIQNRGRRRIIERHVWQRDIRLCARSFPTAKEFSMTDFASSALTSPMTTIAVRSGRTVSV